MIDDAARVLATIKEVRFIVEGLDRGDYSIDEALPLIKFGVRVLPSLVEQAKGVAAKAAALNPAADFKSQPLLATRVVGALPTLGTSLSSVPNDVGEMMRALKRLGGDRDGGDGMNESPSSHEISTVREDPITREAETQSVPEQSLIEYVRSRSELPPAQRSLLVEAVLSSFGSASITVCGGCTALKVAKEVVELELKHHKEPTAVAAAAWAGWTSARWLQPPPNDLAAEVSPILISAWKTMLQDEKTPASLIPQIRRALEATIAGFEAQHPNSDAVSSSSELRLLIEQNRAVGLKDALTRADIHDVRTLTRLLDAALENRTFGDCRVEVVQVLVGRGAEVRRDHLNVSSSLGCDAELRILLRAAAYDDITAEARVAMASYQDVASWSQDQFLRMLQVTAVFRELLRARCTSDPGACEEMHRFEATVADARNRREESLIERHCRLQIAVRNAETELADDKEAEKLSGVSDPATRRAIADKIVHLRHEMKDAEREYAASYGKSMPTARCPPPN